MTAGIETIEDEDLIPVENIVITLTHNGYIKRLPASTYRSQKEAVKVYKEWEPTKMISLNS